MKRIIQTLLVSTLAVLTGCDKPSASNGSQASETKAKGTIGVSLLTTYSMAFEVISLVLLVAILGALAIARTGRHQA